MLEPHYYKALINTTEKLTIAMQEFNVSMQWLADILEKVIKDKRLEVWLKEDV